MSKYGKILFIIIVAVAAAVLITQKSSPEELNSEPTPLPPVSLPDTTSIFIAGDIMLSRNVAAKIYEANNVNLPYEKVADRIQNADIAFANLESPFLNRGNHSVQNSLVFNADPKFVEGLKWAGFDVLSTANNHAFDQGQVGIDYTIDWLTANNLLYTGTKPSKTQVIEPVIKHNDILYGFLAYSYTALNDGGKTTSPYVNDFNNLLKLKQDILDMKGHTADVVIVSMHAGTEYVTLPTQAQIDFAHAAIDAGADLVVGAHSHWVQTVEQYQGRWIFYGLGNFVFDQMWSQETREGLTLLVTFEQNEIKKIELKPVIIDNYCCPRWATEEETKRILDKIQISNPILTGRSK